jgi:hypothetical protein
VPHPFSIIRPDAVCDIDTAKQYVMQQVGIGYVTVKDTAVFRKKVKELFENYPGADWQTIVRTTEWAKSRRRRFAHLFQLVEAVRYAYEDGYLPELDPRHNGDLDEQIREVLRAEEDPAWRRRLMLAQGMQAKVAVLEMWQQVRAPDVHEKAGHGR